ncbi:MAG: hypothetical protein ACREAM_18420, partial [Blastocatellia bacterium]
TFRGDKRTVEIVGVVADTRYENQRKEIPPLLYTPWQQEGAVIGAMNFTLRTTGEPTALAAEAARLLTRAVPVPCHVGRKSAPATSKM